MCARGCLRGSTTEIDTGFGMSARRNVSGHGVVVVKGMLMKRSIILPALVLGLAGAMAGVPAFADDVLYDNTVSGTSYQGQGTVVYAYGSKITDSFNLSSASTVTGITLGIEYTYPLDPLDSVTWAITDLASGGVTGSGTTATVLAAGTATSFIETPKGNNSYEASFSIDSLDLSSGTYWLEIDNMAGDDGNGNAYAVEWDTSGGNSTAYWQNADQTVPSQTFGILGESETATPEPSSLLLLGTGLAGMAAMLKRRLKA